MQKQDDPEPIESPEDCSVDLPKIAKSYVILQEAKPEEESR